MRKWLIIFLLIIISSGISFLFWHNEWKYNLPTPIPKAYHAVNPGSIINLKGIIAHHTNKPVFLHFFNPGCPCSRFNITHFKSLVKEYSNNVDFAVVVLSKDAYTTKEIQDKIGLSMPILFDSSVAISCGVYSTPQAVLIGADHKLYYRGNYNKARYCTDKKTNYAQMAIDSLLTNRYPPAFEKAAIKSYGCELPVCSK